MIILFSVLLGLVSMAAYGSANASSKPLSQRLGAPQTLFLRGITIITILAVASIPSYHYLSHWTVVLAAVGLGMAGYLPVLAFTHAIKESPLGVIAPIAGTSPLVTILLSLLFLGVVLHPAQWVAAVAIISANIAISVNLKNWRQSKFFKTASGIPFALIAALGWGLFFFALVPATKAIGPWLSALLVEVGVTIAAGLHIVLSAKKVTLRQSFTPKIMLNGALICIGTLAFTVGARYFNVGIVAALSNSTALISTLYGIVLFHETLRAKDRVAAVVMVASVAALSLL